MFYFIQKPNTAYILTGGGFLGMGSFGCILYPDIEKNSDKIVSKIVLNTNHREAKKEILILKEVREVDPRGTFHSLLLSEQPINLSRIPDANTIKNDCSTYVDMNVRDLNYFNIQWAGSITLADFVYKFYNTLSKHKQAMFFVKLSNILRGLYILTSNHIFHNDIHDENIMVDKSTYYSLVPENNYAIKLIDFGNGTIEKDREWGRDLSDFFETLVNLFEAELINRTSPPKFTAALEDPLEGDLEGSDEEEYDPNALHNKISKIYSSGDTYQSAIINYVNFIEKEFGKKYSVRAYETYFQDII